MSLSGINNVSTAPIGPADSVPSRASHEDRRALIQAVKAVNASQLLGQENELTFTFERGSRLPVVRIVNKQTGEVVQQIPAEYILRIAEEMKRG